MVMRILEDDDVPAMDLSYPEGHFIDKQPVLILKYRKHAGPLHAHRLIEEDDDENRDENG